MKLENIMNKKQDFKSNIKEYIMTVVVSFIMVFTISFCVQFELMFRSEQNVNFKELNVENLSKFWTIEELEKQLISSPDDYVLNVRLAVLYESLNKLEKANEFYKNALKLSGRSNFSLYSYAMFCARNDLFIFAATLAEELSGSNKQTNTYKAKIYEQLGISFDRKNNISASVSSYQIAYKYAKSIGDSKYLKSIKTQYAQEYVKLADLNIKNKDFLQAISDLKNSLQIKETAIANYKLGLLYLDSHPAIAEKHINKAFNEDVFVVNPYVYNSLLQKLISEAQILKKQGLYNFYNSRLTRFKNKVANSYLYKNEVLIDNSTLVYKKSIWNKIKHILVFEIKNNTKEDIKNLFIKAELYVNGQKYVIEKKVVNSTNPLPAYEMLRYEDMELPQNIEFNNLNQNNDIFVRYFAKRCKEAPWLLLKIDFLNI